MSFYLSYLESRFVHELGISTFRDTQRITIQEMPECAPTGLLPRAMEVYLEGGLVNSTKPGERVRITAVFKPMPKTADVRVQLCSGSF